LIVAASQLDVSISKLIAATVELGQTPAADMLIHSIDLSRKRQIIESYCSMFAGTGIDFIERLEKFSTDLITSTKNPTHLKTAIPYRLTVRHFVACDGRPIPK
jgi:hypothetical protein